MKEYKRKVWQEENSCDHSVKKFKKTFNSSERWRGKREIEEQLKEDSYWPFYDFEDTYNKEAKDHYESTPCAECLMDHVRLDKLGQTLYRLGFVILTDYGRDNYSCKHKEDK